MPVFPEYDGWKGGYPAWNVALWLDNDEGLYVAARAIVAESESRYEAAQTLKGMVEEENPLADDASCFSDILGWCLECIDWEEVAEHFEEDMKYEPDQVGDEGGAE